MVEQRGRYFPRNEIVPWYQKQMIESEEQCTVCCDLQSIKALVTRSSGKLQRAVEMGSDSAVRSLLNREVFSTEELDKALISALVWKFPECLDALLESGARRKKLNSINPYHALFTFSRYLFSTYTSPTSNMLECLRVLTTYPDLDINCKEPEGSYPLYTLIHMMFEGRKWSPSRLSTNMSCLEILLRAGANPNFDETECCSDKITPSIYVVWESFFDSFRECFSSALNGMFLSLGDMMYRHRETNVSQVHVQHLLELPGQICRLLLQHGCNANHACSVRKGATPLHDLMKLWAIQHALRYIHFPLCQVQSLLLSYGADPNRKNAYGSYPVHCYAAAFDTSHLTNYEFWPALDTRPSHVFRLLLFMDPICAAEGGKRIIEYCQHLSLGAGMPTDAFEEIQNSVWRILHEVKTLLSLCRLAMWKATGRNFHAAKTRKWLETNIPESILHDLDNMFVCHCHN